MEDMSNTSDQRPGIYEMYEQLLPTCVYYSKKTRTGKENDVMCRLCGKAQ